MKGLIKIMIFSLFIVLAITSCDKDEKIDTEFKDEKDKSIITLTINLEYPESITGKSVSNFKIKVINTLTKSETEFVSDEKGVIVIPNIAKGVYNILGHISYSKQDYKNLTGRFEEANFSISISELIIGDKLVNDINIKLRNITSPKSLLISEIYSSPSPINHLKCNYIELYNNTDSPIILDGLNIATLGGPRIKIDGTPWDVSSNIYAITHIVIPGSGNDNILQPREFYTIASNAIKYNYTPEGEEEKISVDLSKANIEVNSIIYNNKRGVSAEQISAINIYWDFDNPQVKNANLKYLAHMWWYLLPGGTSTIIFRTKKEFTKTKLEGKFMGLEIPMADISIIDAVDFLSSQQSFVYKRLNSSADIGFSYINDPNNDYNLRKSIRRKKIKHNGEILKLLDTNNSSVDFEESNPTLGKY